MKIIKEFKGFDGHIILYCKYHYKSNISFVVGLRRIWSIRCGLDIQFANSEMDSILCNKLFNLLKELNSPNFERIFERIHNEIGNDFRYGNTPVLERLLIMYGSEIAHTRIKEKQGDVYIDLIKLPKPNYNVFDKIINGKGKYKHYEIIEN